MNNIDGAMALLRIVTGLTLTAHGCGKVFLGGRIPGTARWFDGLGMRPGLLHARLAAATETGAGLLFAAGLFTSLAGAAVVALMTVAGWTVHRRHGFFSAASGWEYNMILAVIAVAVSAAGAGRLSLDHVLAGRGGFLAGWAGLLISGIGGVLAAVAQLACFYRPSAVVAKAEGGS